RSLAWPVGADPDRQHIGARGDRRGRADADPDRRGHPRDEAWHAAGGGSVAITSRPPPTMATSLSTASLPVSHGHRGLDSLNFFVVAVQTSFCEFVTVYLVKHQL